MTALVTDPDLVQTLIAQRQASGADRYDEVWDGVYVMAPLANNEHQEIVTALGAVIWTALNCDISTRVFAGTNISDRPISWRENYRCPDVAVFLPDNRAEDRKTHWLGGPDFAVEVVSEHDRSREKFDFYAKVSTRELMLVDRHPWALELYRLDGTKLLLLGKSTPTDSKVLVSHVVPLNWQLVAGEKRPQIAVVHSDGKQKWLI